MKKNSQTLGEGRLQKATNQDNMGPFNAKGQVWFQKKKSKIEMTHIPDQTWETSSNTFNSDLLNPTLKSARDAPSIPPMPKFEPNKLEHKKRHEQKNPCPYP